MPPPPPTEPPTKPLTAAADRPAMEPSLRPPSRLALPMLNASAGAPALTEVDPDDAHARESAVLIALAGMGRVLVAFSGGVDSTYVAWAAARALGCGDASRALAVTGVSDSLAAEQLAAARALAAQIGIAHELVATRELEDPRYLANQGDRCYWCKNELYDRLGEMARARGAATVIDGSNLDDVGDVRPGRRAAAERSVRSPLIDAGLGKAAIRWLSRRAGLPTWHQPASPCLSSRVAPGTTIDPARLARIERAERAVRALGFRELRVRDLGTGARIEIGPEELHRATAEPMAARLVDAVLASGFHSAFVDPIAFRTGRLNQPDEARSVASP